MNQRTAKLIHRFTAVTAKNPRSLKRAWNSTPRPHRAALRAEMLTATVEKP